LAVTNKPYDVSYHLNMFKHNKGTKCQPTALPRNTDCVFFYILHTSI